MRRIKILGLILCCSLLMLVCVNVYAINNKKSISTENLELTQEVLDKNLYSKFNIETYTLKEEVAISEERAIDIVKELYGEENKYEFSALGCNMRYRDFNLFSESALKANNKLLEDGFINNIPVYIVQVDGVIRTRVGVDYNEMDEKIAESLKAEQAITRDNVVIDANSGELLFTYIYSK